MAVTTSGLASQLFIHANENVFTTSFYWQMTSGDNPFLGPPNLALAIGTSLDALATAAFGTNTKIEGCKVTPEGYPTGITWMETYYIVGSGTATAVDDLRHARLSLISEESGGDRIVNRNQISGIDSGKVTDGRLEQPITDALSAWILEVASNGLVSGGITFNLACKRILRDQDGDPTGGLEFRGLNRWQFNPFVGTRKDRVKRPMGKRKAPEIVVP